MAPGGIDGTIAAEDGLYEVVGARVRLRDDRRRTGLDEARCEVVDALAGHGEGALGNAGLAVARRVAQVIEQDDGILGQVYALGDPLLAEVLVPRVAAAGRRVEPEAVLGGRVER